MAKQNELTPEEKIAGLQDELKTAVAEVQKTKGENEALVKELEQSKTLNADIANHNQELSVQVSTLEAKVKAFEEAPDQTPELKAELEQVKALNVELTQKISELDEQKQAGKLPTVKIGGKVYEITSPNGINLPGTGVVSAEDIKKDKELQAHLIEIGSNILREKK